MKMTKDWIEVHIGDLLRSQGVETIAQEIRPDSPIQTGLTSDEIDSDSTIIANALDGASTEEALETYNAIRNRLVSRVLIDAPDDAVRSAFS